MPSSTQPPFPALCTDADLDAMIRERPNENWWERAQRAQQQPDAGAEDRALLFRRTAARADALAAQLASRLRASADHFQIDGDGHAHHRRRAMIWADAMRAGVTEAVHQLRDADRERALATARGAL